MSSVDTVYGERAGSLLVPGLLGEPTGAGHHVTLAPVRGMAVCPLSLELLGDSVLTVGATGKERTESMNMGSWFGE